MKQFIRYKKNILVVILSFLYSVGILSTSLLAGKYIDALVNQDIGGFFYYSGMAIVIWLGVTLVGVVQSYLETEVIQTYLSQLRLNETEHLKRELLESRPVDTSRYLNMCQYDTEMLAKHLANLYIVLNNFFKVAVSVVAMLSFHYTLIIFVVCMSLLMGSFPKLFEKQIKARAEELSFLRERFKRRLDHLMTTRVTLRNFNVLSWLTQTVVTNSDDIKKSELANVLELESLQSGVVMLNILSQLGMLMLSGYLAYIGEIKFAMIFSITGIASDLFGGITTLVQGMPIYFALNTLLAKFTKMEAQPLGETEERSLILQEAVAFNDVRVIFEGQSLSYPNIRIEPGKKYLLVGPSGSGKSTLLKLLNGDIREYSGTISWDNLDYRSLKVPTLKKSIVTMSQDTDLFDDTIIRNIILGEAYDQTKLDHVIQASHLEDVPLYLPDQSEAVIDIVQPSLSGGQVQRIALARCLYHEPKVLLVDEGTANIDVTTAQKIEQTLLKMPHLTVIMITHRVLDEVLPYIDEVIEL